MISFCSSTVSLSSLCFSAFWTVVHCLLRLVVESPKGTQLFYDQIVFHLGDTRDAAGDLSRLFGALRRIDKTA